MYRYETLKPVEDNFTKGEQKSENNGGDEPNQGHMHIWKCHNEIPLQLLYTNKNFKNMH
jgi:hypothetical protein